MASTIKLVYSRKLTEITTVLGIPNCPGRWKFAAVLILWYLYQLKSRPQQKRYRTVSCMQPRRTPPLYLSECNSCNNMSCNNMSFFLSIFATLATFVIDFLALQITFSSKMTKIFANQKFLILSIFLFLRILLVKMAN